MPTIEREITLCNKLGLHARAATKLVVLASKFDAKITIIQGEKQASATSVLGLLMLETGMGKTVQLLATGPDAQTALDAVCQLIDAKFDEDS
ncbi:HPr family phosphocarrier protein [Shewanella marinintestina]|uniref:HPr family phosphocarrier protein n=1 Tax=Shewanella marinintestina TaxID=190305 RepID=UPI00200D6A99|nr:HPr family phosphocarrier protein [Shewanella marinintestina]MCL1146596.1 HPr family phosphocarrier protein [Shewanella marinintestina]